MEFKKIALGAFAFLIHYKDAFARKLLIPAGGCLLVDFLSRLGMNPIIALFVTLLSFWLYVLLAVITHRIVLLGPESVAEWGISRWSGRETAFLVHALGLGLVTLIPFASMFLLGFIPFIVLFTLPLSFWLLARLTLVLPGIAVDKEFTFQHSWEATRDFQLPMLGVVFLIPFVLGGVGLLIAQLPFTALLVSVYSIVATVYEVVVLSLAYQSITAKNEPPAKVLEQEL